MSGRIKTVRRLSVDDHDRDVVQLKYVYPVVSRRAGGVSVGVNLNPNNACNWRCIYCQVPNLSFGKGPPIDLEQLEAELFEMLEAIVHGDFLERAAPAEARRLSDIAISGNGEPTTSPHLCEAVGIVGRVMERFELSGELEPVLITNGSMVEKPATQTALRLMASLGGAVWFKLDSATAEGSRHINHDAQGPRAHLQKLETCAKLCPTWLQTCLFSDRGRPPSAEEQAAYLACIAGLRERCVPVRGVLLYTLARPSHQPEAALLAPLSVEWLADFAKRIEAAGLAVQVSA